MLQIRGLKETATPKERLNEDHTATVNQIRDTISLKPKLRLGRDDYTPDGVSIKTGLSG